MAVREADEGEVTLFRCSDGFLYESFDDGVLKRGGEVREVIGRGTEFLERIENRCLQTGKGKVMMRFMNHGAWKGESFRVSILRDFFNLRAAGVWELEHASDFIEGFACGVVDGAAESTVFSESLNLDEKGVAA